ncbi:N-glycosylase/DNA lyase [Candidatus Peregrinibacteria bacterium]|nr:N-glycosylase/DNA lyase [Candidatus Peregrinibacteria bacterium]
MKELISSIKSLKNSDIKQLIDQRISDFKKIGKKDRDELFIELCFCLMTANFDAARAIKIQNDIGKGFITLTHEELASELKRLGHRFPNARAKYIAEARKHVKSLKLDRDWLVENIKGLGHKEASHFLRNVGEDNYAIIDFHIIDILVANDIIKKPKTINKKKYLEIEKILKKMGNKVGLTLAELDFYLWYIETGKVLK